MTRKKESQKNPRKRGNAERADIAEAEHPAGNRMVLGGRRKKRKEWWGREALQKLLNRMAP